MCTHPTPQPGLATAYSVAFIIIAALVMMSLFVGTVTMSMSESMVQMKTQQEDAHRRRRLQKQAIKMSAIKGESTADGAAAAQSSSSALSLDGAGNKAGDIKDAEEGGHGMATNGERGGGHGVATNGESGGGHGMATNGESGGGRAAAERQAHKEQREMRKLMVELVDVEDRLLLDGGASDADADAYYDKPLLRAYVRLGERSKETVEAPWFVNLVTAVICVAGIVVGIKAEATSPRSTSDLLSDGCEPYRRYDHFDDDADDRCGGSETTHVLDGIDVVILVVFILEFALKVLAEELAPWRVFKSDWNKFDFVVIVGSFVNGIGSLATMLRLLRLLRVLKLVKSLPQVRHAVARKDGVADQRRVSN